jgi:hypothetical protein
MLSSSSASRASSSALWKHLLACSTHSRRFSRLSAQVWAFLRRDADLPADVAPLPDDVEGLVVEPLARGLRGAALPVVADGLEQLGPAHVVLHVHEEFLRLLDPLAARELEADLLDAGAADEHLGPERHVVGFLRPGDRELERLLRELLLLPPLRPLRLLQVVDAGVPVHLHRELEARMLDQPRTASSRSRRRRAPDPRDDGTRPRGRGGPRGPPPRPRPRRSRRPPREAAVPPPPRPPRDGPPPRRGALGLAPHRWGPGASSRRDRTGSRDPPPDRTRSFYPSPGETQPRGRRTPRQSAPAPLARHAAAFSVSPRSS